MYPFGHGMLGKDRQALTFNTCCYLLPIGYKFMLFLSIITNLVSAFTSYAFYVAMYPPDYYDGNFYWWNLFTCFSTSGNSLKAILGVLIDFYFMFFIWQGLEEKFSTVYMLFQPFIQILTVNLIFAPIGYGLFLLGVPGDYLYNYRWTCIIIIFMYKNVCYNSQEQVKYCFVPCLIKNKYVPLLTTFLFLIFRYDQFVAILLSAGVGYVQAFVTNADIIKLPMSWYKKIDFWMPESIKVRKDFTSLKKVESDLRDNTCICCYTRKNQQNPQQPCVVEIIGGGVKLGGAGASEDYSKKWSSQQLSDEDHNQNLAISQEPLTHELYSSDVIYNARKVAKQFEQHMKIEDQMFDNVEPQSYQAFENKDDKELLQ